MTQSTLSSQLAGGRTYSLHEAKLILDQIYQIWGRVILLPIKYGNKGPHLKDWPLTTFEQTQEPAWQKDLLDCLRRGGNIGALLIDGLIAIDIDVDSELESCLVRCPLLRSTVRTRGCRGAQFWLRIEGDYPQRKIVSAAKINGVAICEWRAGTRECGQQSVLWGLNPGDPDNGIPERPYQWLHTDPLKTVRFDELGWWTCWEMDWESRSNDNQRSKPRAAASPPAPITAITRRLEKRVLGYLAKAEPAIMHHKGENQALIVATVLIWGYALDKQTAWRYMLLWNQKCIPPWDDNDPRPRFELAWLERKLNEALRLPHPKPYGYLLDS